jgi:7,8-dihydropterin-6-yl-methyl-4-(beta-D-ribofuranosyl)aminobenzene 5'-phosphate synthase
MNSFKVTALAENTTYRHNAIAQHGQSILIESGNYKLIFDVGEIPLAIRHNLEQLGIGFDKVNDIAISHRHIDHIGALLSILPEIEDTRLLLPTQMGEPHVKHHLKKYNFLRPNPDGGYDLAISVEDTIEINKHRNLRLVEKDGFEIHQNIYTTGCEGDWMKEQAIVIDQGEKGITIILGCSHPTVEVLIQKAIAVTGNKKVRGIIGGMHFTDFSKDEIKLKSEKLGELNMEFIVPSHCTTVLGAITMKEILGDIVHLSKTNSFGAGNSVEIGEDVRFNFV